MEIFLENLFTTYSNFDYSVLFYLTAFLSVSVVAISKSGFGGGLGGLGVPIMLFILPAKIVLAVFLPLIVLMDLWVIYVWRKFPIYKIILIMCIGGFIGQIAGWYFFQYLDLKIKLNHLYQCRFQKAYIAQAADHQVIL